MVGCWELRLKSAIYGHTLRVCVPFQIASSSCHCGKVDNHVGNRIGWDGSATLRHGSLIEFGCLKFVFAYVSCAPVSSVNCNEDRL